MRAVAIVNGNARGVRGRMQARLERALPGRVRVTQSLDHAREVVRAEIGRGVDLLVLGGGDGSMVLGLTLVAEACRGLGKPEPALGVLRLGSGNAFADSVGASRDAASDLARMAAGEGAWKSVAMLDVLGVRAPFVGVGLDAQLLEDHEQMNALVNRLPGAKRVLGGGSRYVLSVALRSIPRFARVARPHATVRNLGAPAIEMAARGATGREVPTGAQIWTGPATMVTGATIPFFGFGLKMHAFAGHRLDRFQLRCASAGFVEALRAVPAAFRGEYFSNTLRDFLCDRAEITLDREVAVEAGGELLGHHRRIEVGLAAPVRVVHLAPR